MDPRGSPVQKTNQLACSRGGGGRRAVREGRTALPLHRGSCLEPAVGDTEPPANLAGVLAAPVFRRATIRLARLAPPSLWLCSELEVGGLSLLPALPLHRGFASASCECDDASGAAGPARPAAPSSPAHEPAVSTFTPAARLPGASQLCTWAGSES